MKTRFFMKGEVRQFVAKRKLSEGEAVHDHDIQKTWPDGTAKSQGNAFDWKNFNNRAEAQNTERKS